MKKCAKCNEQKTLDLFYKTKNNADGHSTWCMDCKQEYNRTHQYLYKYGITEEQWLELTANGCAICGSRSGLAIDHDHNCCPGVKTCGKCVRGALCGAHNRALGLFKDNAEDLIAAAAYVLQTNNVIGEIV